jgi:hypothetical protein
MTELNKKENNWKGGLLLPKAMLKAFQELKGYLSSKTLLAYPRKIQAYNLITWCHPDKGSVPGELSTILTQTNEQGSHSILAYSSWKLQKCKKNYPHSYSSCKQLFEKWTTSPSP